MDLIVTILPVVTKDLPISPRFTPYNFFSRCKFSTLTTRQPMVEFYLLTFPRFPLRKKEHKSYFGKNRTHDFRTSRCAGYVLDHSGDEQLYSTIVNFEYHVFSPRGKHVYVWKQFAFSQIIHVGLVLTACSFRCALSNSRSSSVMLVMGRDIVRDRSTACACCKTFFHEIP